MDVVDEESPPHFRNLQNQKYASCLQKVGNDTSRCIKNPHPRISLSLAYTNTHTQTQTGSWLLMHAL